MRWFAEVPKTSDLESAVTAVFLSVASLINGSRCTSIQVKPGSSPKTSLTLFCRRVISPLFTNDACWTLIFHCRHRILIVFDAWVDHSEEKVCHRIHFNQVEFVANWNFRSELTWVFNIQTPLQARLLNMGRIHFHLVENCILSIFFDYLERAFLRSVCVLRSTDSNSSPETAVLTTSKALFEYPILLLWKSTSCSYFV